MLEIQSAWETADTCCANWSSPITASWTSLDNRFIGQLAYPNLLPDAEFAFLLRKHWKIHSFLHVNAKDQFGWLICAAWLPGSSHLRSHKDIFSPFALTRRFVNFAKPTWLVTLLKYRHIIVHPHGKLIADQSHWSANTLRYLRKPWARR